MTAKLTGELLPHAQTNITNVILHPSYQRLRNRLLQVLARYPEARAEVAVFRDAGEGAVAEMRRSAPGTIEGTVVEISRAN